MPKNNQPLQIRLTEPVIFLKGPSTGLDFRGRPQAVRQDGQPAMVRGLLTLRLNKPTRIRSIAIKLEGKARTEWPEGIGSKRMDTSEEHMILCDQTTYFSAYQHDDESRSTSARRARSVGPGVTGGGHEDEDIDDDLELPGVPRETDDTDDFLTMGRRGREGAGPRRTAMIRSSSAMPGTHDNHSWHRDGFSRRPSFEDSESPTGTGSFNLGNLNIEDRGPSPAYTPHASPPRTSIPLPGGQPSRPSSLRQSNTAMQPSSREPGLSPIASAAPSQSASERGDSAEAEHRRPAHTLRSVLSSEAVQEGAVWSPNMSAEPSNQSESALQDEESEEPTGTGDVTPLRPILQPRSSHMSTGTGEVRFQDPVEQSSEIKDPATDRRQSVQDDNNDNDNDNETTPPTAPADTSVPPPSPAPVLPSSHADPAAVASALAATANANPAAGNRAASVRTYNSTHSTSSASISLHSDHEQTREAHPTGVQAISVANTAHNSPVSSAPPSIRNRSSTETLGNTGRASGTDGSSPSASRRTSVLSNSNRQSSELSMTNLATQPSQENLSVTRQGRTTRLGSTSTIVENSPGPSMSGSHSNIPSSLRNQPRTQRSTSGTPSVSSGPGPSASARNQSVSNLRASSSSRPEPSEDGRGRKSSKFSLAATLRGISRDVKETFHHGRHPSKSRSRMSSPVRADSFNSERPTPSIASSSQSITTSSMARTGSGTGVNDTIRRAASRNPSWAQEDFHPTYGRGGAGSRRSRSRERTPSTVGFRERETEERSRSRARGRHKGMKVLTDKLGLGEHEEHHGEDVHNWKEFRKGTYNYPISFPIPVNAPPTIHAEFGSVTYRLKATVIRVGALTPNLSEDMEVTMIATPQEDDMEETENVIVERQWEEQMRYQITLGGKAFPVAGTIPISIRLMPLLKCKIHRLTVALEEKTDYFAQERKVARHETPKRFVLLFIKQPDHKERIEPLLPIISDDPLAAEQSPVAEMARQAVLNNPLPNDLFDLERDPNDSMYASLMEPTGPWHLEKELHIPDCASKIKFTTKHEQTNITIGHWLKVTIRVERGDDEALDAKGRRKQFDIIIETPIKILDCRVNPQWNSLPTYSVVSRNISSVPGICSVHGSKPGASNNQSRSGVPVQDSHISSSSTMGAVIGNVRGLAIDTPPSFSGGGDSSHAGPSRRGTVDIGSPSGGESGHDTLLDRNIVYDRLMSGQVTETGEVPPSYGEALAAAEAARSRSVSRVRDMDEPIMMGRGRSEGGRSRSRLRD
ncbi:hypothetical protein IAT40_003358 [Kwoniella sp. CBS 6097]